jgi:hypothetical protein
MTLLREAREYTTSMWLLDELTKTHSVASDERRRRLKPNLLSALTSGGERDVGDRYRWGADFLGTSYRPLFSHPSTLSMYLKSILCFRFRLRF